MMKRGFLIACLMLVPVLPALSCDVRVEAGWIRQPAPMAKTLAAYATLVNSGKSEAKLVSASSAAAASAQLHESMMHGTTAMMRPVEQLVIPAGGRVELAPGGKHLMLIDPKFTARPGDRIAISLKDASGCVVAGEFVVRPLAATPTTGGATSDQPHRH